MFSGLDRDFRKMDGSAPYSLQYSNPAQPNMAGAPGTSRGMSGLSSTRDSKLGWLDCNDLSSAMSVLPDHLLKSIGNHAIGHTRLDGLPGKEECIGSGRTVVIDVENGNTRALDAIKTDWPLALSP